MTHAPTSICSLCALTVKKSPICEDSFSFCCHGCAAVYRILKSMGELSSPSEHPIFKNAVKAGIISNPFLLEEIKNKENIAEEESIHYRPVIEDMWCPSCAEVIKWILLKEKGITFCLIDYFTDLASIKYCPRYISKDKINALITGLGYTPLSGENEGIKKVSFTLLARFTIAAFCTLNIMMFSYPIYASYFSADPEGYSYMLALLSFGASLPLVTYCLWPILRRFRSSLKIKILGMESLVVTGVLAAFSLSVMNLLNGSSEVYFDSMGAIITFVLLGKIIESKAKFSSKDSLMRIARSGAKRGRKKSADGSHEFVPIKEICIGDTLIVVSGEKIVLDGIILEGDGICDESLMTGESFPVIKKKGDPVLAGTYLQEGNISYEVTADADKTTLHKIIDVIENDLSHKTSYVRAADSIVKLFVPVVFLIATISAVSVYFLGEHLNPGSEAWERALSILLISCPCAIGIAAPLSEAHMIRTIAEKGALIRNRGCLALLGKETHFISDKTGTLTEGSFEIIDGLASLSPHERSILKKMAMFSNHPIAVSLVNAIKESPASSVTSIEEIKGKGMKGKEENTIYLFGSRSFISSENNSLCPFPETAGPEIKSIVFFSKKGGEIMPIILGDTIKKGAIEMIRDLHPAKTILISGDTPDSVAAVAKTCNFDRFYAEFLPLQKREFIESLKSKGHIVAMLGDGINDAPALTAAAIGMSVVSASDISIQVSDILLLTDKLKIIPEIRAIAGKGRKILKQNLFWAFFYNIIGISLACTGLLMPFFAAGAMVLSSLMVILNARRIRSS